MQMSRRELWKSLPGVGPVAGAQRVHPATGRVFGFGDVIKPGDQPRDPEPDARPGFIGRARSLVFGWLGRGNDGHLRRSAMLPAGGGDDWLRRHVEAINRRRREEIMEAQRAQAEPTRRNRTGRMSRLLGG